MNPLPKPLRELLQPVAAAALLSVVVGALAGWQWGSAGVTATVVAFAATLGCLAIRAGLSAGSGMKLLLAGLLVRLSLFLVAAGGIASLASSPATVIVTLPFYFLLLAVDAAASMGHTRRTTAAAS